MTLGGRSRGEGDWGKELRPWVESREPQLLHHQRGGSRPILTDLLRSVSEDREYGSLGA